MGDIDKIIFTLFSTRWVGEGVTKNLESMRAQLYENLNHQISGYWSGSTAYSIMVDGGFLKDGKSSTKKELTAIGKFFMDTFDNKEGENNGN